MKKRKKLFLVAVVLVAGAVFFAAKPVLGCQISSSEFAPIADGKPIPPYRKEGLLCVFYPDPEIN